MELIATDRIQDRIFTVRNTQVMLDKDLAAFYDIKPIRLREQVKRNPNRFPIDFVFQLNEEEVEYMVSQNAIPSKQSLGENPQEELAIIRNFRTVRKEVVQTMRTKIQFNIMGCIY